MALLEETPDQSLEVLLEHLGKALKGERTYIFEEAGIRSLPSSNTKNLCHNTMSFANMSIIYSRKLCWERHSGIRSVQNLEAVINEGLRVALLEETPDQSLEVLLEHLVCRHTGGPPQENEYPAVLGSHIVMGPSPEYPPGFQ